MPPLRQSLKKSSFWCVILFALVVGAAVDARRVPSNQIGGKSYVRLVRLYQTTCSPHLTNHVRCRYVPTC